MPVLIRYAAGLATLLVAFFAGWSAFLQITAAIRLRREATHVTGWLTNWSKDGALRAEVALGDGPEAEKVWVAMNNSYNVRLFRDVDVYIHPTDPAQSRLGGFFQLWFGPVILVLVAIVFLAGAAAILMAPQPGLIAGPLPQEWVGRWAWFGSLPRADVPADIVLGCPSYFWIAGLLLALVPGLLIVLPVMLNREAMWHERLVWGTAGVVVTLFFVGAAVHFATYEVSASGRGVRERSLFGWREVPWESVQRVEDETVREQKYNPTLRRRQTGLTKPWLRSLVLVGEGDRQMMSIGVQLEPKAKWQELKDLAARKTGLKPEPTERLSP